MPPLSSWWRTAPYLQDGSSATLRDVVVRTNGNDEHGQVRHLREQQIENLIAYVLLL